MNELMVQCHDSNVNLFTPTHRYGREKNRKRKIKKKVLIFQAYFIVIKFWVLSTIKIVRIKICEYFEVCNMFHFLTATFLTWS